MKSVLIYITCKDRRQAEDIGKALLKKRLVACVNIIDAMHSMYLWPPGKGTIEQADEVILLCKTLESKWQELEREVLNLHSYSSPDIMAIPISRVTQKYADWLLEELA